MAMYRVVACVEKAIQPELLVGFARVGLPIECTSEGKELMTRLYTQRTDALILDMALIREEMEDLCRLLETDNRRTVLIALTVGGEEARIEALRQMADVCFDKPVQVDTLIAQVQALFRRIERIQAAPVDLAFKDIHINLNTHEVYKDGKPLNLTYTQFKLLYLLASQRNTVLTRNEILKKVWGENAYVTERTVDVHVKRLREKLGDRKGTNPYILTIHGLGYRLA